MLEIEKNEQDRPSCTESTQESVADDRRRIGGNTKMPDSEEHEDITTRSKPDKQKPTNIQIYTAVVDTFGVLVLLSTMIGVFWYAEEAREANQLTHQVLEANTRAYIEAGFSPGLLQTGNGGSTMNWRMSIVNNGKSAAGAKIKARVIYSIVDLPSGPSLDCAPEQYRLVHTGGGDDTAFAESCEGIPVGQLTDFRSGVGWVFVVADIQYGQGHRTHACQRFKARPDQGAIVNGQVPTTNLFTPELCTNHNSNYAY